MYKREWTKELEKKAWEELNETPKLRKESVKHIKKWLSNQRHLSIRTDKNWILSFLRGCKFNLEKTKEKMEYLHTIKSTIDEFYLNRDPLQPELQEILKQSFIILRSTKNEDVVIVRWADVKKVTLNNLIKLAFMFLDIGLIESSTNLILGYHIIIDLKGFSLYHFKQATPTFLKNLCNTLLKAYPVRIKGIYLFNSFPLFPMILKTTLLFISEKIRERIKVYGKYDVKEMGKYVSIDNLPKEYGGNSESLYMITERCKAYIESYREWFIDDEKYKTKSK